MQLLCNHIVIRTTVQLYYLGLHLKKYAVDQKVISLCFFLICLLPFIPLKAFTQEVCDSIRTKAGKIGTLKEEAEMSNMELRLTIERLNKALPARSRIAIPNSKLNSFDESPRRYHNDRKWADQCPNWTVDWGKIKDFRESNYDKFIYQNSILEGIKNQLEKRKSPDKQPESYQPDRSIRNHAPFEFVERKTVLGKTISYCIIDPTKVDLRVDYQTPHSFFSIQEKALQQGKFLAFAINGGIFHPDKKAVGLLVANGRLIEPINRQSGSGNFYMMPNGVFGLLRNGFPFIYTTQAFLDKKIPKSRLKLANQSGPMLIINGKINKLFQPGSNNVNFRNGVGVRKDGTIVFAISEQMVNFYQFAFLFQQLGCTDALYLDGTICRMYLPKLNKTSDLTNSSHLGPIFYILVN